MSINESPTPIQIENNLKSDKKENKKSDTNYSITDWTNAYLTKSQREFMEHAFSICTIQKEPFCCADFILTRVNFRQKIHELKPYIEKVISSNPCFYKVKGVELPPIRGKITQKPMDVNGLDRILADLKEQPPTIHDLKLRVESDLHEKMIKQGFSANPKNHSIVISNIYSPDSNLTFKVVVYPNHFQMDVGCSYTPLVYSFESLLNLVFNFGQYINSLRLLVKDNFSMQPIPQWIITHYHFGKDGSVELNGKSFHFRFSDLSGTIARLYSKRYPDGSTTARIESIQTPRITLQEKIMETLPEIYKHSCSNPVSQGMNETKEVN